MDFYCNLFHLKRHQIHIYKHTREMVKCNMFTKLIQHIHNHFTNKVELR